MHLYYNVHDKSDLTKLGELLALETAARAVSDDSSDSLEQEGLKRQVNFIFRTINGINAFIGLTFFLSGVIIFFEFRKPESEFGGSAFLVVSLVMGLCGVALLIYSFLGLMLDIKSFQQILLFAVGGGLVFTTMVLACAVRIPSTQVLLGNVSYEMAESLNSVKKGDPIQQEKWNYLQTTLRCCGITNYLDWCEPKNLTNTLLGINRKCSVPTSCFATPSISAPALIRPNVDPKKPIFIRGCYGLRMETLLMNVNLYRFFGYIMIIQVGFITLFDIFVMTVIHRK